MKRILACALIVACLLTAFAMAEGEALTMKVIKCKQHVNIRQYPSTDYAIVGQAPLGAVIEGCEKSPKNPDWYAVQYNGVAGYIRGDFLEPVEAAPAAEPVEAPVPADAPMPGDQVVPEETPAPDALSADVPEYNPAEEYVEAPDAFPTAENAPIANIFEASGYDNDTVILDADAGNVHVVARRIYQENSEYLAVAALDAAGAQLWMLNTATSGITELSLTDAFIAGTDSRPLVMLYNAEVGLWAVDPETGVIRWLLSKESINLGASISHAVVSGSGILYIGGYYGPDPVAIDANGIVLWQANSGRDDIYWLCKIEATSDGLVCAYGTLGEQGNPGTVIYDYNGAVKEIVNE